MEKGAPRQELQRGMLLAPFALLLVWRESSRIRAPRTTSWAHEAHSHADIANLDFLRASCVHIASA